MQENYKNIARKITNTFFLLSICSCLAIAGESSSASSSVAKKSQFNSNADLQPIPVITNEAEYAAWVKKREGAGRTSYAGESKSFLSKSVYSAKSLQRSSSRSAKN